ncbi:unnamed protein product [Ectocarpus sp. 6 AP-2014]
MGYVAVGGERKPDGYRISLPERLTSLTTLKSSKNGKVVDKLQLEVACCIVRRYFKKMFKRHRWIALFTTATTQGHVKACYVGPILSPTATLRGTAARASEHATQHTATSRNFQAETTAQKSLDVIKPLTTSHIQQTRRLFLPFP